MNNVTKVFGSALVAGMFTACASAPPPPPPPPPAKVEVKREVTPAEHLANANQAFEKGDYAAALTSYDSTLAKEPTNTTAMYNRAVALQKLGKLAEAQKAYEAVLAANPEDPQASLNLGAILKAEGKTAEAVKLYERALAKDEFNANLLNNLAVLYREQKKHDKAIEAVRKLLMRDQDNVDAYKNLALVYFDQKKYKLTQTILENAQKLAKKKEVQDADIYVNQGMVFLAINENGKAMAAFKKAIEIDPNHVTANYNIGALALGHRDYKLAAKAYGVVKQAWPSNYEVTASLGYALQGLQQHEDAAKTLEEARKLKLDGVAMASNTASSGAEDDEQIVLQLVSIWQTNGNNNKALTYAEEYMRMKGISCGPDDFDGFCGRVLGIKTMIEVEKEAAAAPAPEPAKPKAGKVDVFTDNPDAVPVEGAEGAEGENPDAPPAEEAPVEGAEAAAGE